MLMKPLDTSEVAEELQTRIIRNMSYAERLKATLDLSDLVRSMAFARIYRDHPNIPESDAVRIYIREVFGKDTGHSDRLG